MAYNHSYTITVDNKKQIEQVLVIFDEMLKLEHLRLSSNKAIDTLK